MYLLFLTLCYYSIQLSSSYVLLAANLEDFHSLAKRLVPEHVADEQIPLPTKSVLRENTRPDNYEEGDPTYQSEEVVKHKHLKRLPTHKKPVKSTPSKFELQLDNIVERVKESLQKDWSIFLTTKDGKYTRDSDDDVYTTTEMSTRELVIHDFEYYKNHRPYSFNTPQVRYVKQSRDEAKAKRQEKHRTIYQDKNVEPQDRYASNLQPKIPKYIDPDNEAHKPPTRFKKTPSKPSNQGDTDDMLKERDVSENLRPIKQSIKDNMFKERDIYKYQRPTKQSIKDDMFKERDTYENSRPSKQRFKDDMLKEIDIYEISKPTKERIEDDMLKETDVYINQRPTKQRIKDNMFIKRDIYENQRPTKQSIKDDMFKERDTYESSRPSKQRIKDNMLKERDIYENKRPTKQRIKYNMFKERDIYENQRPTKQRIKDNMFKEKDVYGNQRPAKQRIKDSVLDEKDIYESEQENEKIVTEATEDPADLLKETDIQNIKDSYEDYVTPKKDDSFEAAEPAKSLINIKETINNKRLPQNPYELDRREVTEADKDITHNNYNYKRDPDIDDDRTINYKEKKKNYKVDHQKRTTATTDYKQDQYDDFQTTSNVRTRFTNKDRPYPIKRLPERELPEKNRNVGKERFVEVHEGSNSEVVAASSSIYLGTQERHILHPSHAAIPETDTQQRINTQSKQNNKETERQELSNKNNVQEASTEDALHIFKDIDMLKIKDSYEDYVTPKRDDNIYEEIEQTKSDAKRENRNFDALISAVHLPTNSDGRDKKRNQFRDAEETNYFNKKINTADDDTMNYNKNKQNNRLNANRNENLKQDLLRKITFTSESPTKSIFDLDKPLADLDKPLVDLDKPTAYADQIALRLNDDLFKTRAIDDIKLRAERFLLEEKIKEGTYLQ